MANDLKLENLRTSDGNLRNLGHIHSERDITEPSRITKQRSEGFNLQESAFSKKKVAKGKLAPVLGKVI